MNHRDGDILMLTQGPAAGCLVFVSDVIMCKIGEDSDIGCADQPYFCDDLVEELSAWRTLIHEWRLDQEGPLCLPHIKLGRWK